MESPAGTSTTTEMGSPIFTPQSPSTRSSSSASPSRPCTISNYDQKSIRFSRTVNDLYQQWVMKVADLHYHTCCDEEKLRLWCILSPEQGWPYLRFVHEFEYILDYITDGYYPVFYAETAGFDVSKYLRVKLCAEYYGITRLADWIRLERYRNVVVKVYDLHEYQRNLDTTTVPADTTLLIQERKNGNGLSSKCFSWTTVSCRTEWNTKHMIVSHDKDKPQFLANCQSKMKNTFPCSWDIER